VRVIARILRELVACPLTTTATASATAAPPSSDSLLAKVETKLGGGINNLSIALAPWMAPISPQAPAEVTHREDVLDLRESPVVQFMSYLASTGLGKGTISTNAFLLLLFIKHKKYAFKNLFEDCFSHTSSIPISFEQTILTKSSLFSSKRKSKK